MSTYTVKQILKQTVIQTYLEKFDPSDNEKWTSLIERIDPDLLQDEFPDHSKTASSDIADWLKLYELLNCNEYEEQEDDYWVSDIKGFTEYSWEIVDENGDVVDGG